LIYINRCLGHAVKIPHLWCQCRGSIRWATTAAVPATVRYRPCPVAQRMTRRGRRSHHWDPATPPCPGSA
jgi:hypothetical protein